MERNTPRDVPERWIVRLHRSRRCLFSPVFHSLLIRGWHRWRSSHTCSPKLMEVHGNCSPILRVTLNYRKKKNMHSEISCGLIINSFLQSKIWFSHIKNSISLSALSGDLSEEVISTLTFRCAPWCWKHNGLQCYSKDSWLCFIYELLV